MQEMWVRSLGQEDPMEEEMATDSSILAWEIPWTEEPGGVQSMASQSRTWLSKRTHTTLGRISSPPSILVNPKHMPSAQKV